MKKKRGKRNKGQSERQKGKERKEGKEIKNSVKFLIYFAGFS